MTPGRRVGTLCQLDSAPTLARGARCCRPQRRPCSPPIQRSRSAPARAQSPLCAVRDAPFAPQASEPLPLSSPPDPTSSPPSQILRPGDDRTLPPLLRPLPTLITTPIACPTAQCCSSRPVCGGHAVALLSSAPAARQHRYRSSTRRLHAPTHRSTAPVAAAIRPHDGPGRCLHITHPQPAPGLTLFALLLPAPATLDAFVKTNPHDGRRSKACHPGPASRHGTEE